MGWGWFRRYALPWGGPRPRILQIIGSRPGGNTRSAIFRPLIPGYSARRAVIRPRIAGTTGSAPPVSGDKEVLKLAKNTYS